MDLLILPLKTIYQEIESKGIDGGWWDLYLGPMGTKTDKIAAEKFRDAVEKVDRYKFLAPEKLYPLIDKFILGLKDIRRSKDATFQQALVKATNNLYSGENVRGGLIERRYYELKKELDSLNKGPTSKIHGFIQSTWQRFRPKPPLRIFNDIK
jgi:hypothetical protein